MILRFLNWQGSAGIALGIALSILLSIQKIETAHWKKQSASFEQLYRKEQAAFATTLADARAAAEQAHAEDRANAARVASEQALINQRSEHDLEARLAAARSAAQRLRNQSHAAADPGVGGGPSMPGISGAAPGVAQAAGEDRFSQSDRLLATEQAIQLDELIKWVRAQAKVPAAAE